MGFWIVVLPVIGLVLLVAVAIRGRTIREEKQRRLQDEEESRERLERWDREEKERQQKENQRLQGLQDATLYGNSGESFVEAAERLGVTINHESDEFLYGRFQNDAYLASKTGGDDPVVFRKVDPEEFYPPPEDDSGLTVSEKYGWRIAEEFTERKEYGQQLYDGDDVSYVTLAVDQHGRVMQYSDHGGARWHKMTDPKTGEYVFGWEDMLTID